MSGVDLEGVENGVGCVVENEVGMELTIVVAVVIIVGVVVVVGDVVVDVCVVFVELVVADIAVVDVNHKSLFTDKRYSINEMRVLLVN